MWLQAGRPNHHTQDLVWEGRGVKYRGEFSQSQNFAKAWGTRAGLTLVELEGQDHYLRSTKARNTILSESLRFLDVNYPGRR